MKRVSVKRGFTLVETLVAVAILVGAVTGPLSTAARSLKDSRNANDQVAAYYLAQEVIEVIRGIRDDNSFAGRDWVFGIPSECLNTNASLDDEQCVVDGPTETILPCSGACPALQQIDSDIPGGPTDEVRTFRQGQSGADNSIYTRSFTLKTFPLGTTLPNASEVSIRVKISWPEGAATRTFVVGENIFDWK